MADMDFRQGQSIPEDMVTRYKDVGGGVYAKLVAAVLSAGEAIIGKILMGREYLQTSLVYSNSTTPTSYIDTRKYSMIAIWIPAAAAGKTATPMFSSSGGAGNNAKVPNYFNGGAYAAMPALTVSASGDWMVVQADTCPAPYFGLQFNSAATVTCEVWMKG